MYFLQMFKMYSNLTLQALYLINQKNIRFLNLFNCTSKTRTNKI